MALVSKTPNVAPKSGVASTLSSFKTNTQLEKIHFLQDKFSFFVLLLFIFSFIGQVLMILNSYAKLPPEIPLFYSQEWGLPILGRSFLIWLIPAVSVIFFAVNYLIAFIFLATNKFLIRTLLGSIIVISLANLINVFKIISLLA